MTLVWWNGLRLRLNLNDVLMVLLLVLAQVTDWTAEERRLASTFTPVPAASKSPTNRFADDPNAAAVGVRLFHDEQLSANGKISLRIATK